MTFAPNFLISKLAKDLSAKASQLKGSFDLSSLKRINSGGEAVVTSTVKAFFEALDAVRGPGCDDLTIEMAAGFGMTETWLAVLALRITSLILILSQRWFHLRLYSVCPLQPWQEPPLLRVLAPWSRKPRCGHAHRLPRGWLHPPP